MKLKFKFSLRSFFEKRRNIAIVSVLLAFLFWLAISVGQTPTIDQTFSNIPITFDTEGTVAAELGIDAVSGALDRTVSVKVSGPAYILSQISNDDIVVTASLSEVTKPGQYDLSLSATKKTLSGEYSVVSITPSSVSVNFDYIDTKQFTVTPKVTGVSAVEGLVAEEPIISEASGNIITIKGARTEIKKIAQVVAEAKGDEILTATKTYDGVISLYDEAGNILNNSNYNISSSSVKISVPISKTKTVPVVATYINAPEPYKASPINSTLSVNEVTIIGPADIIDRTDAAELAPIDFNEISRSNNKFSQELQLPSGIKTVDKVKSIDVTINTGTLGEKSFTISKVSAINNPGYTVTLKNDIRGVKMCGPSGAVYSVRVDELYAVVDLSGKTTGEYTTTVTIKSDKYPELWQIGVYQATVSVK